jgi:hypothetical protein
MKDVGFIGSSGVSDYNILHRKNGLPGYEVPAKKQEPVIG